jgi:hypothetical protein
MDPIFFNAEQISDVKMQGPNYLSVKSTAQFQLKSIVLERLALNLIFLHLS